MNERNTKNYVIVEAAYSERLKTVVHRAKAVGMVEVFDYIEKAKTAQHIVYSLRWPNGAHSVLTGKSERRARAFCRVFADWMKAKDSHSEALKKLYECEAKWAMEAANSDNVLILLDSVRSARLWMD